MAKKQRKITKAIIATAGYGTRSLPATKNQPKQMLPIIDTPIIHYVAEECVKSGITDIILVLQFGQTAMEDYFDNHSELERYLEANGKTEYLKKIREIPEMANFVFMRQKKSLPYGNGTPLIAASNLIDDDETFVDLFGDDLVKSKVPCVKQLIDAYNKYEPDAVIGSQEIPWRDVNKYGTIRYKKDSDKYEIEEIVEKPTMEEAKSKYSNKVQYGRFVFNYSIIETLQNIPLGKGNELWLTDAVNALAQKGSVIAPPVEGTWLTTGDPLNYLKATVEYALDRPDLASDFRKYIKKHI